ncbi:MAG: hypothetical protein WBD36_04125 [Bacteroidota bacterium]
MKKNIFSILFVFACLVSFQCKQTNEPDAKKNFASNITETSAEGPFSFVGTIDLGDWDPSSYGHLTLTEDYWIGWASTDTIGVSPFSSNSIRVHNLSQSSLWVKTIISLPFKCSIDSINLNSKQTSTVDLTIDTNLVGQDTLILGTLSLAVGNDKPINYAVCWAKPKSNGGIVVERSDSKDCLFPAYPNPADGSISLNYSVKKDQMILLYVLNSELQPIDTLVNGFNKAGTYQYTWLTTSDERSKLTSGIYRIVYQSDSYSRYGDIYFQK